MKEKCKKSDSKKLPLITRCAISIAICAIFAISSHEKKI